MSGHVPVMLREALDVLAPRDGGRYLDGTFGGGGYADAILGRAACTLWAIDRDPQAIERGAVLAARHPGRLVVVACHAGVVEASLLAKLPVVGGNQGARMKLRTQHASLTTWEVDGTAWKLIGYNDGAHHLGTEGVGGDPEPSGGSGRSWMTVGSAAARAQQA